MLTRPIPSSGEALPVIGLGTWQAFDVGAAAVERDPLAEVLRLLFEGGGSIVDSSPMYGAAEGVTGDLLAATGARPKAFIATKVWTEGRRRGMDEMHNSLRLLDAEAIDLMQVHNLVDWRVQLATLREWKERGIFRYIGVTHYTPGAFSRLADVIEEESLDFVQFPFSIGVRDAEDRLLEIAADTGTGVIVNRPYEGGTLFRALRGRSLPEWAAEFDCRSWGQFFLKYILGHPAVTCVIPGTSEPRHMLDNIAAGQGRLPDDAMRRRMRDLIDAI